MTFSKTKFRCSHVRKNRRTLISKSMLILACCSSGLLAQENAEWTRESPVNPNPSAQQNLKQPLADFEREAVVGEINAIRQQLGETVADQLQGLVPDSFAQQEFNGELNRLHNERKSLQRNQVEPADQANLAERIPYQNQNHQALHQAQAQRQQPHATARQNQTTTANHARYNRNSQTLAQQNGVQEVRHPHSDSAHVPRSQKTVEAADLSPEALREIAQQLEASAAGLEELKEYTLADQLRSKAQSIWKAARQR